MSTQHNQPKEVVAIVGAGVIGAGWSALFMANDFDVVVWDPAPDAEPVFRATVDAALADLAALGRRGTGSLRFVPHLAAAVSNAVFVQENAPEREDVKAKLLAEIDAAAPERTIVASSTSSLLRSSIAARCKNPDRVIVGHPFNPTHLIPLVEIVGPAPDAETTLRACAFYRSVGKETIVLKKEAIGHLVNRINSALWREAVAMFQEGLADPADIDRAIKAGSALRWPVVGPYETFHLAGGEGGIAHYFEHLQPVQEEPGRFTSNRR